MVKTEMYPIARLLPVEELDRRIRSLEKDARVLKRLYFVRYRYDGDSVEEAAKKVGVTKMVGYQWQRRWNQGCAEGLVPRFAGGRPSKLDEQQKKTLKEYLKERDDWTTKEIMELILEEFGVEYTLKQVRVILKGFKMNFSKPYQQDQRRPEDAEDRLKKTRRDEPV
jgi:putative transposase